MSVRERPKKEKAEKDDQSKDSIDDWLENISIEKQKKQPALSKQIPDLIIDENKNKQEKVTIKTSIKSDKPVQKINFYNVFMQELPSWVKRPWMFVKPTHEAHLSSWIESWKNLILDYSRTLKVHVINLTEMQTVFPFENTEINKQISQSNFTLIVDHMVENGLAKWLDDGKILIRIYYKTNEQWSEIIIKYLFDTGYAAEVLTFYEIESMKQEWSTLPRVELADIFEILVQKGRAAWVGSLNDTISFII